MVSSSTTLQSFGLSRWDGGEGLADNVISVGVDVFEGDGHFGVNV